MFKKPSIVIAALAVSAAMPMSAFAQRFQFYQEDVSRYNHGDAASTRWVQYADGAIDTRPYGWMKTYTARGDYDKNEYGWTNVNPITDVQVQYRDFLPTTKIFSNRVGKHIGAAYYRFDTVLEHRYMSMDIEIAGADDREDYYVRWIMYVPPDNTNSIAYQNTVGNEARMTLAFRSSNTDGSNRYEAGVCYTQDEKDNPTGCKVLFRDVGNGQWRTAGKSIASEDTGAWYNCLLKINAFRASSDSNKTDVQNTASFKMWKYGADEPAAYDITYNFKPKLTYDNILVFQPYRFGVYQSVLQAFCDFQFDGYINGNGVLFPGYSDSPKDFDYTGKAPSQYPTEAPADELDNNDRNNAEAVFSAAQQWNPKFPGEIRTTSELNNALEAAATPSPQSGVDVKYELNRASCMTLENNRFTALARPENWSQYALTATFTKGHAVTKKSYPLYVKQKSLTVTPTWTRSADGAKAKATVTVLNDTGENVQPAVILASYDRENRFSGADYKIPDAPIPPMAPLEGQTGKWTYTMNESLGIDNEGKVKVFVWKDLRNVKYLTGGKTTPVSAITAVSPE